MSRKCDRFNEAFHTARQGSVVSDCYIHVLTPVRDEIAELITHRYSNELYQ